MIHNLNKNLFTAPVTMWIAKSFPDGTYQYISRTTRRVYTITPVNGTERTDVPGFRIFCDGDAIAFRLTRRAAISLIEQDNILL